MRAKTFVVWCVGLCLLVAIGYLLGITELVSNSVETRRLEAQAEADQERARLVDAQNERLRTLPLVLASSADTGLSVIYAMFDRLALVVLGLLYLRERGKHHDNNMSSLR